MAPQDVVPARRCRVLHAVPDLAFGGLQRLTVQLAALSDPSRFDVRVLVFGQVGPLAASLEADGRVVRVGRQSRLSMLWPRTVAKAIADIAPDVVHSHSGVWLKTARAARLAGVRALVHTDHGRTVPDPWQARLVDRLASRYTDVVVAVSAPLAETLRQQVVARPDRVRLIINGVDTAALRPRPAPGLRRALGIPSEHLVIGSIGRLESIKGYDVMVESFAELLRLEACPPVTLVVAGDGALRPSMAARVAALGIQERVRLLGWREDLPELLATFDVFALTSRSEGTSVSLLEAMSAAVCPVVTDVGGNGEVLGAALRHRLVPPGTPGAIARGWLSALLEAERRVADGAAARARVVSRYSLQAMVAAYEALYDEVRSRR